MLLGSRVGSTIVNTQLIKYGPFTTFFLLFITNQTPIKNVTMDICRQYLNINCRGMSQQNSNIRQKIVISLLVHASIIMTECGQWPVDGIIASLASDS